MVSHEVREDPEQGGIFLDEDDVIQEIEIDEEDLPDADVDMDPENVVEEPDDSVHVFTGHTGELYSVACSPCDPFLVATGGGDDKAFLWRIGHVESAAELSGHSDSVSCLEFSSDGKYLASGGFDGIVQIWDMGSNNLIRVLDGPGGSVEWLRWHPKGYVLLAGSDDKTAWMWNVEKNVLLTMFSGHRRTVSCGNFTPNGKTICTGSDDASLRVWNPKTGQSLHVIEGYPYHTDGLTCLAIKSDSTVVITGAKDGSVHLVSISSGTVLGSLVGHTDSIECIGLSSSSNFAATGSMDGKLIIWDLRTSSPRCTCDHEEGVSCLMWCGGSRFLATGCVDGRVLIWDSLLGDCFGTFHGHSDAIQDLAISSDLAHLVAVSIDKTARVFEISHLEQL